MVTRGEITRFLHGEAPKSLTAANNISLTATTGRLVETEYHRHWLSTYYTIGRSECSWPIQGLRRIPPPLQSPPLAKTNAIHPPASRYRRRPPWNHLIAHHDSGPARHRNSRYQPDRHSQNAASGSHGANSAQGGIDVGVERFTLHRPSWRPAAADYAGR